MVPVVGYVRASRVAGRGGDSFLSPELQRQHIADVARREGLDVVEGRGPGGTGRLRRRRLWNRTLEMVEQGEVEGIAVWNLARF